MSLLLESIKVLNNKIYAWPYHRDRIDRSLKVCYGNDSVSLINLSALQNYVDTLDNRLYKLRISYDNKSYRIEHQSYQLKSISSLKLVNDEKISYSEKYLDRKSLTALYDQKESADDILIVKKKLITDSYYCNVALLKDEQWHTPLSPLLRGVKRQQLLDRNAIIESDIYFEDLQSYSHIRLFNAMIEFGEVELIMNCIF